MSKIALWTANPTRYDVVSGLKACFSDVDPSVFASRLLFFSPFYGQKDKENIIFESVSLIFVASFSLQGETSANVDGAQLALLETLNTLEKRTTSLKPDKNQFEIGSENDKTTTKSEYDRDV